MSEKSIITELLPWAPYIGTLGGALVTGLVAFGLNFVNKRSEERKHLKSLAINAALENWKQTIPIAKEQKGIILPLGVFIMTTFKTFDLILDKNLNKDNIAEKLKEIDKFGSEIEKYFKSQEGK